MGLKNRLVTAAMGLGKYFVDPIKQSKLVGKESKSVTMKNNKLKESLLDGTPLKLLDSNVDLEGVASFTDSPSEVHSDGIYVKLEVAAPPQCEEDEGFLEAVKQWRDRKEEQVDAIVKAAREPGVFRKAMMALRPHVVGNVQNIIRGDLNNLRIMLTLPESEKAPGLEIKCEQVKVDKGTREGETRLTITGLVVELTGDGQHGTSQHGRRILDLAVEVSHRAENESTRLMLVVQPNPARPVVADVCASTAEVLRKYLDAYTSGQAIGERLLAHGVGDLGEDRPSGSNMADLYKQLHARFTSRPLAGNSVEHRQLLLIEGKMPPQWLAMQRLKASPPKKGGADPDAMGYEPGENNLDVKLVFRECKARCSGRAGAAPVLVAKLRGAMCHIKGTYDEAAPADLVEQKSDWRALLKSTQHDFRAALKLRGISLRVEEGHARHKLFVFGGESESREVNNEYNPDELWEQLDIKQVARVPGSAADDASAIGMDVHVYPGGQVGGVGPTEVVGVQLQSAPLQFLLTEKHVRSVLEIAKSLMAASSTCTLRGTSGAQELAAASRQEHEAELSAERSAPGLEHEEPPSASAALDLQLNLALDVAAPILKWKFEPPAGVAPPRAAFLNKIKAMPFGVLGRQRTRDNQELEKGHRPDRETVIVDPAGLNFIKRQGPGAARGASESIYRYLGIQDEAAFPEGVVAGIRKELDAKLYSYGEKHVIHAIGPDFSTDAYAGGNQPLATEALTTVYHHVLREYAASNLPHLHRLRILPLGSGDADSGRFSSELPKMTVVALGAAFERLDVHQRQRILDPTHPADLELCIFMEEDYKNYALALEDVLQACQPTNQLTVRLGNLKLRTTAGTECSRGRCLWEDGQTNRDAMWQSWWESIPDGSAGRLLGGPGCLIQLPDAGAVKLPSGFGCLCRFTAPCIFLRRGMEGSEDDGRKVLDFDHMDMSTWQHKEDEGQATLRVLIEGGRTDATDAMPLASPGRSRGSGDVQSRGGSAQSHPAGGVECFLDLEVRDCLQSIAKSVGRLTQDLPRQTPSASGSMSFTGRGREQDAPSRMPCSIKMRSSKNFSLALGFTSEVPLVRLDIVGSSFCIAWPPPKPPGGMELLDGDAMAEASSESVEWALHASCEEISVQDERVHPHQLNKNRIFIQSKGCEGQQRRQCFNLVYACPKEAKRCKAADERVEALEIKEQAAKLMVRLVQPQVQVLPQLMIDLVTLALALQSAASSTSEANPETALGGADGDHEGDDAQQTPIEHITDEMEDVREYHDVDTSELSASSAATGALGASTGTPLLQLSQQQQQQQQQPQQQVSSGSVMAGASAVASRTSSAGTLTTWPRWRRARSSSFADAGPGADAPPASAPHVASEAAPNEPVVYMKVDVQFQEGGFLLPVVEEDKTWKRGDHFKVQGDLNVDMGLHSGGIKINSVNFEKCCVKCCVLGEQEAMLCTRFKVRISGDLHSATSPTEIAFDQILIDPFKIRLSADGLGRILGSAAALVSREASSVQPLPIIELPADDAANDTPTVTQTSDGPMPAGQHSQQHRARQNSGQRPVRQQSPQQSARQHSQQQPVRQNSQPARQQYQRQFGRQQSQQELALQHLPPQHQETQVAAMPVLVLKAYVAIRNENFQEGLAEAPGGGGEATAREGRGAQVGLADEAAPGQLMLQLLEGKRALEVLSIRLSVPQRVQRDQQDEQGLRATVNVMSSGTSKLEVKARRLGLEVHSWNYRISSMEPVVFPCQWNITYECPGRRTCEELFARPTAESDRSVAESDLQIKLCEQQRVSLALTPEFFRLVNNLRSQWSTGQEPDNLGALLTGRNLSGVACRFAGEEGMPELDDEGGDCPLDQLLRGDGSQGADRSVTVHLCRGAANGNEVANAEPLELDLKCEQSWLWSTPEGELLVRLRLPAPPRQLVLITSTVCVINSTSRDLEVKFVNSQDHDIPIKGLPLLCIRQDLMAKLDLKEDELAAGADETENGIRLKARYAMSVPLSVMLRGAAGAIVLKARPAEPQGSYSWCEAVRAGGSMVDERVTCASIAEPPFHLRLRSEVVDSCCNVYVEALLTVKNACPFPIRCHFQPQVPDDQVRRIGRVTARIRPGPLIVYDGVGGRVSVRPPTLQTSIGQEERVRLRPVRLAQGLLWWETGGRRRWTRLPPSTNTLDIRRLEEAVEFECYCSPGAQGSDARCDEVPSHGTLEKFCLGNDSPEVAFALGSRSEDMADGWSLPLKLTAAGLSEEEHFEVKRNGVPYALVMRRAPPLFNEITVFVRTWFVNATGLDVRLAPCNQEGPQLPEVSAVPEAGVVAGHRGCLRAPEAQEETLDLYLQSSAPNSAEKVTVPLIGSFRDVALPDAVLSNRRCVVRAENIARSSTFGVQCKLLTLMPALMLFNRSNEEVSFSWEDDIASEVVVEPNSQGRPSQGRPMWNSSRVPRPGRIVLRNRRASRHPLTSHPLDIGLESTGAYPLCLRRANSQNSPECELVCVYVDDDMGTLAITAYGPERCHTLVNRHEQLQVAVVDEQRLHTDADLVHLVHFGDEARFGLSGAKPYLVLRTTSGTTKHEKLDLSKTKERKISRDPVAYVRIEIQERVAVVTISSGIHQEGDTCGQIAQHRGFVSIDLPLGLRLAWVADAQADAFARVRREEVLSLALDGIGIGLATRRDDSQEGALKIKGAQVDMRPAGLRRGSQRSQDVVFASGSALLPRGSDSLRNARFLDLRVARLGASIGQMHIEKCRLHLEPMEVNVTEALGPEIARFLAEASPGHQGLQREEALSRKNDLRNEPPSPGMKLRVDSLIIKEMQAGLWLRLFLPETHFLPRFARGFIEVLGFGAQTLVVDGASVYMKERKLRSLIGSFSTVVLHIGAAYKSSVVGNVFKVIKVFASSNAALGGIFGCHYWTQVFGCCERRRKATRVNPPVCEARNGVLEVPITARQEVEWRIRSIDHADDSDGATGRYFNFNWADMEYAYGSIRPNSILAVNQWRGGRPIWNGHVVVRREANGGSDADSHGSRHPSADQAYNQWQVGDIIRVEAAREIARNCCLLRLAAAIGPVWTCLGSLVDVLIRVLDCCCGGCCAARRLGDVLHRCRRLLGRERQGGEAAARPLGPPGDLEEAVQHSRSAPLLVGSSGSNDRVREDEVGI